jgi:hypothetical protein
LRSSLLIGHLHGETKNHPTAATDAADAAAAVGPLHLFSIGR